MIKNKKFPIAGATTYRPPELWLNHKSDICFLYGKNVGCLHKILVKQTGDQWSPLQNEYAFQINDIQKQEKSIIFNQQP